MLKISDALKELIDGNPWLSFGFHHRLLNLSRVAQFLKSAVEARTLKDVQASAILMNLSRLQNKGIGESTRVEPFFVDKIHIHSGLCSLNLAKTPVAHRKLNRFVAQIQERRGFLTITEGVGEITLIVEQEFLKLLKMDAALQPAQIHYEIGAVGVSFPDKYLKVPGLLYRLLQQVALQNINVIEVASTATEFNIFLHEKDVRLGFDAIYRAFAKRGSRR